MVFLRSADSDSSFLVLTQKIAKPEDVRDEGSGVAKGAPTGNSISPCGSRNNCMKERDRYLRGKLEIRADSSGTTVWVRLLAVATWPAVVKVPRLSSTNYDLSRPAISRDLRGPRSRHGRLCGTGRESSTRRMYMEKVRR